MVTQNSHLAIGLVVSIELLLKRGILQALLVKQTLECDGGIVGTEDLGGQSLHLVIEMFI